MEGLRYILKEIEARRALLHAFTNGIRESRRFSLFAGGVPDFARDGELIYRATSVSEPQGDLTVAAFKRLYEGQFGDLRRWSRLSIPLEPKEPIPNGCEINEVLAYELGGGYCTAYILVQLWSPSLQQPDRWFYVYVEDNYLPGRRYPQRRRVDINGLWRLLGKGVPEYAEYKDFETMTPSVYRYARWKKDARKARPRSNPAVDGSECGGNVWVEDGRVFTAPMIIIDEDTTREQIWGQLLLCAWGNSYFDSLGEREANTELGRYYPPQVLSDILLHMRRHAFSPYDAKSNLAYMKQLSKWYGRPEEDVLRLPGKESAGNGDNARSVMPRYLPKSVLWAHEETGIPTRTIYHLVGAGRLEKAVVDDANDTCAGNIMMLSDDAMEKLRGLATQRARRQAIYELAGKNGKNRAAVKKWLQRNRDLTDNESEARFTRWLGIGEG